MRQVWETGESQCCWGVKERWMYVVKKLEELGESISLWNEDLRFVAGVGSYGSPFMCIIPSDGGLCRPEGPWGPRAVQTTDPYREVNIMLALLISPDWPMTMGGPQPQILLLLILCTSILPLCSLCSFFLTFLYSSMQRLTWSTTCCKWRWERDIVLTRH